MSSSHVPGRDVLEEEYQRLLERISDQRERAERLRELADRLMAEADRDETVLRELASLAGSRTQLHLASLDSRVRGQRLEQLAIEVLERDRGLGEPIHYRDWYELLRNAGLVIAGKDPTATFLAQIVRSSRVEKAGPSRSGLYRVIAA